MSGALRYSKFGCVPTRKAKFVLFTPHAPEPFTVICKYLLVHCTTAF